jgi:hypothetical protein
MAEHKHLISLLNKYKQHPELAKEAVSQKAEMESYEGGFSKQSGFIRRMMAENALKHKGQYRRPTDPLAPGSTMNKPVPFEYEKLATPGQKGKKTSGNPYGASPFIQKHFGTTEYVPFERKRGQPLPTEPFPNKKRGKKTMVAPSAPPSAPPPPVVLEPPPTEAQKDEDEELPPPPPPPAKVAAAPPPPPPTVAPKAEPTEEDFYKPSEYKEDEEVDFEREKAFYRKFKDERLNYFVPQKGGFQKGAECIWFGVHMGDGKTKAHTVQPPLKIKPGINLRTIIKKEESEYFNAYRGNVNETNFYIPPSECVVKDIEGTVLKVKEVKLLHTTDFNDFWKLGNNYVDGLSVPQLRVIMEQPVESEFHRRIDYAVAGSTPFTVKNELFFSLKKMKEVEHIYYTGFYASMVMDGPAKTFAETDKKLGYTMKREKELDAKQREEYEAKLDEMVVGWSKPRYTLTMNGIGEWIRLRKGE